MRIVRHVIFWLVAGLFIVLFIGSGDSKTVLLYVGLLLPVAITISYLFNYWLFPQYLFTKQYFQLTLYGVFLFVVSIFLQMLIVLTALVLLGNYTFNNMKPITYNIGQLAVGVYFVVFLSNLIYLIRRWTSLEETKKEEPIHFKVDRKSLRLLPSEIQFVESMGDYVKIHDQKEAHVTKEKISSLEGRLPPQFLRTHRSFIVNEDKIKTYSRESLMINTQKIPISRKYKKEVLQRLESK